MFKQVIIFSMIVISAISVSSVDAQKSVELYIPIGQSPGLSGQYTIIGKIDEIDPQNQIILISDASGSHTVEITESTEFFLDRSKVRLTNTYGTLADCKVGDTVEVKFKDNDPSETADWIKVEKAR
jgi:hypothetical protein